MSDDDRVRRPPPQTFVSRAIPDGLTGKKVRIARKNLGEAEQHRFAYVKEDLSIRVEPKSRREIKATFFEDESGIRVLTIQRFNRVSGPSDREYFSFVGSEIDELSDFISFYRCGKSKSFSIEDLQRLVSEDEQIIDIILESETLKHDLVAIGYRRRQIEIFGRLLHDNAYFAGMLERTKKTPEALWQQFFEANTWIFGYGLSYQFLTGLDHRRLETVVRGNDLASAGKRVDALMKTQARINAVCFVEIKRHDTTLLASQSYRPEVRVPSAELVGGVSQIQVTVEKALDQLGKKIQIADGNGDPTGETLFSFQPRSFLVIGKLDEMCTPKGVNEAKYRSFELYRRNVIRPEIITFDELFQRAKFIVDDRRGRPED